MKDLEHEKYMKMCFDLALKGAGYVSPNPMVGAVLVKNGKIVGKGYHRYFGGAHAEVNAINSAGTQANGADLYVNLEPCSHYGKTPPCVDLIIKKKIKRVIIATRDPNPLVNGTGIRKLKEAKIEVIENVLKSEAIELNEAFFKFIQKRLPFVALKIAQTIDAKIADSKSRARWITSSISRKRVHILRSQYDAVMIGANTVLIDNPQLTVRLVNGKNPIRVILDGRFQLSPSYNIFIDAKKVPTFLFVDQLEYSSKKQKVKLFQSKDVKVIPVRGKNKKIPLKKILKKLYAYNIASVLVEGGQTLFTEFLKKKLADRAYIFIAPKILGNGLSSVSNNLLRSINNPLELSNLKIEQISNDILIQGKIKY